jgi:hypothetical protein
MLFGNITDLLNILIGQILNKAAYNSGFAQAGLSSKLQHLILIGLQLTGLTSS